MAPRVNAHSINLGLQLIGDDKGVQLMLNRLDTAFSPAGIAAWMQTAVDPWIRSRTSERFASEGDELVGKWLPLRPATEAIRQSKGFPGAHPINRRTGQLERYITRGAQPLINPSALGATYRYPGTPPSGELGTKLETAQRGKPFPRTPPRPVLAVGARDLVYLLSSLSMWAQNASVLS